MVIGENTPSLIAARSLMIELIKRNLQPTLQPVDISRTLTETWPFADHMSFVKLSVFAVCYSKLLLRHITITLIALGTLRHQDTLALNYSAEVYRSVPTLRHQCRSVRRTLRHRFV